jgi:hypothetical protein
VFAKALRSWTKDIDSCTLVSLSRRGPLDEASPTVVPQRVALAPRPSHGLPRSSILRIGSHDRPRLLRTGIPHLARAAEARVEPPSAGPAERFDLPARQHHPHERGTAQPPAVHAQGLRALLGHDPREVRMAAAIFAKLRGHTGARSGKLDQWRDFFHERPVHPVT